MATSPNTKPVATAAAAASATAQAELKLCLDGTPMPDPMPTSVTLTESYGFYDDEGGGNFWSATQVVTDPADVLILVERKAPISYQLPASEPAA